MIPARISPRATADLIEIADYLADESFSITLGKAFLRSVDATIKRLQIHPELGRVRASQKPRLQRIRSMAVESPFSKYLIFYQAESTELTVIRILHGSRSLKRTISIVP